MQKLKIPNIITFSPYFLLKSQQLESFNSTKMFNENDKPNPTLWLERYKREHLFWTFLSQKTQGNKEDSNTGKYRESCNLPQWLYPQNL